MIIGRSERRGVFLSVGTKQFCAGPCTPVLFAVTEPFTSLLYV